MMIKVISANMYQKSLILCSKSLLNVLHNTGLIVWLPWQYTEFQTSPILKAFGHLWRSNFFYANGALYLLSSNNINMLARVCDLVQHIVS